MGPVLERYGFDLLQQPERLRNLVEHRCRKQGLDLPAEETWTPVQERWLTGWPVRGSSSYVDRYRSLRTQILKSLGGTGIESWLGQLPEITVMPTPRSEVEIGRAPGRQPNLEEGLARLGWGGRLVLDLHPQQLPSALPESELHILGEEETATEVDMGGACWRAGWLRLENLSLKGTLKVDGGLVEIGRCRVQPGARLEITGPGAILHLEQSDLWGLVNGQADTLIQADNCTFEGSELGMVSLGLVHLQGTAFCGHTLAALRLLGRSRALLEDCQLRDSLDGLQAGGQSKVWISQSWFRSNRAYGLTAQEQAELEIQSCNFRHNGKDGLRLGGECRVHLRVSNLHENGEAGARWGPRVHLERAGNSATGNPAGDWLEDPMER